MVYRRRKSRRPRRSESYQNRSKNIRQIIRFTGPRTISNVPRNTGLSAGGMTTTIVNMIGVNGTVANYNTRTGWGTINLGTSTTAISSLSVLSHRPDALRKLVDIYAEVRINRITAHWTPCVGFDSHGRIAFSLVDGSHATDKDIVFNDVASSPNASVTNVGERSGREWVPTGPKSQSWTDHGSRAAHLIFGADKIYVPVGSTGVKSLGHILIRVNMSLRSPYPV